MTTLWISQICIYKANGKIAVLMYRQCCTDIPNGIKCPMILSCKVPKGLKYNNLVNKTKKRSRVTDAENKLVLTSGWWGGGREEQ